MSSNLQISNNNITAPTPQNTPLNQAPISLGLSRPTVPDISEDNEAGDAEEADQPGLSGIQEHMLGMVQGKLAGLIGRSSGYIEGLPIDVKLSVEGLKGVQVKHNELQNKYKRECLELEKKVRAVYLILRFIFSLCPLLFDSTWSFRSPCMRDVMPSSRAQLQSPRRRSQLASNTRSRMMRSKPLYLKTPRPAPVASPSFGLRPCETTLGLTISSPSAMRVLSNTLPISALPISMIPPPGRNLGSS